ncbi:MAG: hypothetical protein FWD57_00610, partial [Polyangiaceae bacterium]|nr:hypothetical protein [Polyangiaceae bacterium]
FGFYATVNCNMAMHLYAMLCFVIGSLDCIDGILADRHVFGRNGRKVLGGAFNSASLIVVDFRRLVSWGAARAPLDRRTVLDTVCDGPIVARTVSWNGLVVLADAVVPSGWIGARPAELTANLVAGVVSGRWAAVEFGRTARHCAWSIGGAALADTRLDDLTTPVFFWIRFSAVACLLVACRTGGTGWIGFA